MCATANFIRQGDLDTTFRLAEMLVDDEHDFIQKAVGGGLREAVKQDSPRLLAFLDGHASTMPSVALRQAIERLDPEQRSHYMSQRRT